LVLLTTPRSIDSSIYGINSIAIYKDGEQIFSKPLQPDFVRNRFVRCYLSLFTETNHYYVDEGNGITRNDYPDSKTLFAFDLTADLGAASGHWELVKHGSIRLEIHFSQALTATINAVIYGEFDNLPQIDHLKNVIFDYSS